MEKGCQRAFFVFVVVLLTSEPSHGLITDINAARQFLTEFDRQVTDLEYRVGLVDWAYSTNITDYNRERQVNMSSVADRFTKEAAKNASLFDWRNFADESIKRQFRNIAEQGTSAMSNTTKLERLNRVLSEMEGIYSTGKVCGIPGHDCMSLEPGLTRLLAESRDYDELAMAWKRWRDVSRGEMKDLYTEFVQLSNEGVRAGGHNDTGEYWKSWYESDTFEEDLQNLLHELQPLYESLHAYIRNKLKSGVYMNRRDKFPGSGHIPAHLLGNMWTQSWINIYDQVEPFAGKASIDVTPVLKAKNYTAEMMFRTAEEFFVSLGLRPMSEEFWNYSMIERPSDGREVVCHASAWDFKHGNDTRIKMCTDITMDDLITIHHEMGHIQYYLQYQNQPASFRGGANPGFHEAIGDVLALSVSTPKHLHAIGLLDKIENDREADINFLMLQALDKITFLPFGYLIDQWRWSVFRGETTPKDYNKKWWDLRCKYQGISPPVTRSETDFDAGAKYHIPANTPYIRYFVSFVIQFQFHQALCKAANQTGPLYQCDIYKSKEAGKLLGDVLKLGSSKPWPEAMYLMTGQRKMSAKPILEYFQPLTVWLNQGFPSGWNKSSCPVVEDDLVLEERVAVKWLADYDRQNGEMRNKQTLAQWNYGANITDYNQEVMVNIALEKSEFDKKMAKAANQFPWQQFNDTNLRRQFKKLTDIGTNALENKDQLKLMTDLQAKIEGIYGKAKVHMSNGENLLLEPGLTEIMTSSRNYSELKEAWIKWRNVSGRLMKEDYANFVDLSNKAVRELGYKDTGEYWRSVYETPTFQTDLENLLDELKPLYSLLHAYVRKQLMKQYGAENFPRSGHIPAHLLGNMWAQHWNNIYSLVEPYKGREEIDVTPQMIKQVFTGCRVEDQTRRVFGNMWAQQWNNIYDLVEPYKGREEIDVTPQMIKQNYTVQRMFEVAESFFKSLGLLEMPPLFWNRTIMVNPKGVTMVCHASAWDFYDAKDFRIKMCTEVNMEELIVIHHEMGHIQYFLQYKDQPVVYRDGANPGFHEAIGDVMALSVSTPKHLHTIGLLGQDTDSHENDINFLMKMALEKIAFLPFGYLIDQWRWSVFSGETPPEKYNKKWWDLRCKYQGISPPAERLKDDFDPGAKYHIPANVPYIRYFVSFVVQFQFHKALCDAAGHEGPLHKCDIYNSKAAGNKMRELLQLGSSKPWQYAMRGLTGSDKMSVDALKEYFKPLETWLKNQTKGDKLQWSMDTCSHMTVGDEARVWLEDYETMAEAAYSRSIKADWNYNTDIKQETQDKMNAETLRLAAFEQSVAKNASSFDWKNFKDPLMKREFQHLTDIGISALDDKEKLKQLTEVQSKMESIYSKAKVCLTDDKCLKLDPGKLWGHHLCQTKKAGLCRTCSETTLLVFPRGGSFAGLSEIMATSRNYDELLKAWKTWRDESGKKMRNLYPQMVNLRNEAIRQLNYSDTGAYWRSAYESDTFESDIRDLLEQLKPLYQNLHTYVRRELMKLYGEDKFPTSGHIPAHLLGNMWGQQWNNLYDIVQPFKQKQSVDVTPALKQQGYTARRMFQTSEEFFKSIGLKGMPQAFWNRSMIVRPPDREVVCHASAWDFYNRKDFGIKMCTKINMEDFITIHHEMGHVEYYLQYMDQPVPFRRGANPGFHEAIGDVIALSVSTPKHLRKINLLQSTSDDEESEINFLMSMALEKIAFLPFGYLIDQWRWSVFSGETTPEQYNQKWWDLRCKYQGLSPPVNRSSDDFDPGAKFHIAANYAYIRYFVSYVIQFQFQEALCKAANHTGPLHRCDIYQSMEAGDLLGKVLRLGSSKPWQDVMEIMTGQRKMDARPLMEYFKPLISWLQKQNHAERPGWSEACPVLATRASNIPCTDSNKRVTLKISDPDPSISSGDKQSVSFILLFTCGLLLTFSMLLKP